MTIKDLMQLNEITLEKIVNEGELPENWENREITFRPSHSVSLADDYQGLRSFMDLDCLDVCEKNSAKIYTKM